MKHMNYCKKMASYNDLQDKEVQAWMKKLSNELNNNVKEEINQTKVTSEEEEKALLKKKYGAFYIAILVDMFLMDVENLNPSEISDNIGLVKLKSLFE